MPWATTSHASHAAKHISRRQLAGLLGSALALTACSPNPTVLRTEPLKGQGSAVPDPTVQASREVEAALVAALAAATTHPARDATSAQKAMVRSLGEAHRAHLDVLSRRDPLRPRTATSASPTSTPKDTAPAVWSDLVKQLSALEARAATAHRAATLAADEPATALLYASLATFAHVQRQPGSPVAPPTSTPARIVVGTRTDALTVLLSRVRALVEGLEIGCGQLPSTDPRAKDGRARLVQAQALRDDVVSLLTSEKAPVPPAALGYQMPGRLTDVASATVTWGTLELDVLSACARLAAASTGSQRRQALDWMDGQADRLRALGRPVPLWPGWV
ncbi:DUF4439 domain-containing protein [Luteococcus sp. Sow4_B9]|uniref:DUF4439 domain-containing protein n=1 Tax=Luteococcus sp. Sow4_B9 TaxID=3438792 RepID=UPI003F955C27